MGDPWTIVPYNDPFDFPLPHDILDFLDHHIPTSAGPSIEHDASSFPPQNDAFFQGNDPNSGQVIEDAPICDFPHEVCSFETGPSQLLPHEECNFEAGPSQLLPHEECNFEAGPSQLHGESHPSQENLQSHKFPDVLQFSHWPENPVPFHCSCCQVLREIIHTNGIQFAKLELHGRLGVISHAILLQNMNFWLACHEQLVTEFEPVGKSISFCSRSIEDVKNFIRQYSAEKNAAGYFTLPDPLSAYYEALCIGMEWNEDLSDEFLDTNADNSGGASDETEDLDRTARASLATQRERAGKMKLSDFKEVFHLPIEEAAKQVNLCPTVVKKICRKEGLPRWPHRKIKSIVKKMTILRGSLNSAEAASRAQTEAEIARLRGEIFEHCGGMIPSSLNLDA